MWNYFEKFLYIIFVRTFRIKIPESHWDDFIQFVKFGLVGVSNTLISYISYLLFVLLGCHYLIASILSFVVSVTNSFYWNNRYVFREEEGKKRSWWHTYIKTFLAYASTGLVLNNILLVLWVDVLGISELVAPLVNLIITIPLNYIINKFWAFKSSS